MKLIVNADDFGMSYGVNYGIYHAHKIGLVTSTTLMVTLPGVGHAKILSEKAPNLGIGLHLNITLGKPLTPAKSLVKKNGDFYKPKEKPNQDIFIEEEIYQEFLAQYNLFVEIMGKKPTHIDSHLYAHQLYEKATRAALKLSNEMGIAVRGFGNDSHNEAIFLDSFKYKDGKDLKEIIKTEINNMEKNKIYELMVHPAFLDSFVLSNSTYKEGRVIEFDILIDKEIINLIKSKNIELINFSDTRR